MKLSKLPKPSIERIRTLRFDRILEKHEGLWDWSDILDYYEPEFFDAGEYQLLLPIPKKNHKNISILKIIPSSDERTVTVFLKDTTHLDDPDYEMFESGRLAICKRLKGESFYLAYVYHEWFIVAEPP